MKKILFFYLIMIGIYSSIPVQERTQEMYIAEVIVAPIDVFKEEQTTIEEYISANPKSNKIEVIDEDELVAEVEPLLVENLYLGSDFKRLGVIQYDEWTWTWYSENVLPGYGLNIPGRHLDEQLFICDENDYICIASSTLPQGTIIRSPFGKYAKVYDCGCSAEIIDVYVGW